MIPNAHYELLDFGQNEKLESFGGTVVRRQTPSAMGNRNQDAQWDSFDLRGTSTNQGFHWTGSIPDPWWIDTGTFRLNLRATPTGQIGVFPEQSQNWNWITNSRLDLTGLRAINLFAYTGGTSLALASRGAQVVHVDAAKSVVNWARSNAKESKLESAPIRWIVEDAMTFVQREVKRGNRYDVIVADPPSFGRGPAGTTWKIQRDLEPLIDLLAELTAGNCKMILVSCHTPGIDHAVLGKTLRRAIDLHDGLAESFEMSLVSSTGRSLPSGSCFRWMKQHGGAGQRRGS